MKKCLLICLMMITILCLSACGKTTKPQTVINNVSGKCPQSVFANSSNDIAVSESGYYVLEGLSHGKYLSYISKNGAKSTYLCSKPECHHVDNSGFFGIESCNAHVGAALPQSVVYHNGYVYVLRYDEKTYDVTLVKISADGSVHEDIMVVGQSPDSGSYYEYVFADDKTVFMVYDAPDYTGEMRTVSLDKLDLDKKEKTSVYMYTETGASISFLKILNNNIFFRQVKKTDGAGSYELMRYDMESGQVNNILEGNIIAYTIADNGQIFYYMSTDAMYSLDLNTMQSKKIRECDEDTMYAMLSYDGTYLYLDNMLNRFYHNAASEHQIFVCDLDGNTVSAIPTGVQPAAVSDPDYILTQEASNEGIYWMYIKKEDIRNDAVWRRVERY